MCIRDSNNGALLHAVQLRKADVAVRAVGQAVVNLIRQHDDVRILDAVSYTHLDVYKRQTKSGRKTPYFVNTGNYKTGLQNSRLGEFYAALVKETDGDQFDACLLYTSKNRFFLYAAPADRGTRTA